MSLRMSHHATPSSTATKAVTALLARFHPKHFRLNYSPQHKTFITHWIASDAQHPLCAQRKREHENRKEEGLWWHVTTTVDLSKSSVVRNTCRKRLRRAFADALRERGFDERGKLVEVEALEKHLGNSGGWLKGRADVDIALTGGLRFHVLGPLIPAKYVEVKEETGMVIEALLDGVKEEVAQRRRETGEAKAVQPTQWSKQTKIRKPHSMPRDTPALKQASTQVEHGLPVLSFSNRRQPSRTQRRTVNLDT